jgi:TRAP-type C4-dicarboxylate transport system permease small subunit
MRLVAAIALGVFAVGAVMTWATDWAIGGADGDIVGAALMIGAGVVLLALILLSASRGATGRTGELESEAIEEPDDRLSAGWPRR